MSLRIPELALPLLTAPHCVVIATNMPDGTPHQSIVWHLWEDPHILISSYGATQKVKNLRRDPRVSITVFAPHDPYNYVVVRGVVQLAIRN
ncbi:MAG UNVERIFIED_CONTAM: PPOX class F420-dependent oxidoreductase [Anaerolineae bacterium]|jgi:PPOX class probable F420-dependent enzyme